MRVRKREGDSKRQKRELKRFFLNVCNIFLAAKAFNIEDYSSISISGL